MKTIKKIDILSAAKMLSFLVGGAYLVIGIFINVLVFIFGIPALKTLDFLGLGSGLLATLLMALLVAAICFLIAGILAWLYNLVAKLGGGLKVDLADVYAGDSRPSAVKTNPQEEINHLIKNPGLSKVEEPETFPSNFPDNPNFLSS